MTGTTDQFAAHTFFAESGRVQRLDLIFTLIGYGHTPLALIGPAGAGKSTLLGELQKRLGRTYPIGLINAAPHWNVDTLLDEAQRQFTHALTRTPDLERAPAALLIVDDADTLTDMTLQVLLTPVTGHAGQVRVLISGAPELVARLHSADIPPIKILELLPFSTADTERFIRSRSNSADISRLLTSDNILRISQNSGGWPGGIIAQAQKLLTPPRVSAPVMPAKSEKKESKKETPPPPPSPSRKKNARRPFLLQIIHQAVNSYWFWPTLGIGAVAVIFLGQPTPEAPPAPANDAPRIQQSPPVIRTRPVPPPLEEEPLLLEPQPVVTPPPPQIPEPTPVVVVPPEPPAPPATTVAHSPPAPHTEPWLRIQTPQDYTLQLSGGNTDEQLRQFIREWKLDDAFVAHTLRNGRDWYLLLYGVYPTRRQAEIAAQRLPPGIGKPWIRTFGSVQKDLQSITP